MASLRCFVQIDSQALNTDGYSHMSALLKSAYGIAQSMFHGETQKSGTQLDLIFDNLEISLKDIEKIIEKNGGTIASMYVHFPSGLTGINDPYSASAKSFPLEKKIGNLEGIVTVSTGSEGTVKVEIAPSFQYKDAIIQKIMEILMLENNEKP